MRYFAKSHNCCTCEYWDGPRQIQHDPRVIECSPSAKGVCCGPSMNRRGKTISGGTRVSDWQKCYEIKRSMLE
jgi:hypothetical protein